MATIRRLLETSEQREAQRRVGDLGTYSGVCDSGQHLQAACSQADETAAAWAQPV